MFENSQNRRVFEAAGATDDQDAIVKAQADIALNGANVLFDFAANGAYEEAKLYMTLVR